MKFYEGCLGLLKLGSGHVKFPLCRDTQIAALPLATYEMKHDSVQGRRHLGPVGPDLEKVIPGSVEIHEKSTVPSPNKVWCARIGSFGG